MEVTDVKVFPVSEERLKAYATITFDDCFVVRDLTIIHGNSGLFVAMPSKKRRDGTFKDTAHPLNNETRQMIESRVLDQYETELSKQGIDTSSLAPRRPFPNNGSVDDRVKDRPNDSRPSKDETHAMDKPKKASAMDDGDDLPDGHESTV